MDTLVHRLHEAIAALDIALCASQLAEKADVHRLNELGRNAFHECAAVGSSEIMKLLLGSCTNSASMLSSVNQKDDSGNSPIYLSLSESYAEVSKQLLESKAEAGVIPTSMLHKAIQSGSIPTVKVLLEECRADIDCVNAHGCSAVHIATNDMFNTLPNTVRSLGKTSRRSDVGMLKLLLESKAKVDMVNKKGNTALHDALLNCDFEATELLIQYGSDVDKPDSSGCTPVHVSVMTKSYALTELLITNKAKVDTRSCNGNSPLYDAVRQNNMPLVSLLVNNGADVNGANTAVQQVGFQNMPFFVPNEAHLGRANVLRDTPLHIAVRYDLSEMVQLLVSRGAEQNLVNGDGNTPFLDAIRHNFTSIAQLLLDKGAILQQCDGNGDAVINQAAQRNHIDTLELLKRNGCDLDEPDAHGNTPLHDALESQALESIEWQMLKHGANLHKIPDYYRLFVRPAIVTGNIVLLQMMIQGGAEITERGSNNDTCLHAAAIQGDPIIVDQLLVTQHLFTTDEVAQYYDIPTRTHEESMFRCIL